jgi:hypothetical protein
MISRTSLIVASGIFLGLSLGFEGYCVSLARDVEAALAIANEKLVRLDASAQQTRNRLTASQQDAAALQSRVENGRPAAVAAQPAPDPDPLIALAANSKLRDIYMKFFRSYTARRFGWMYPILGFSRTQIDRFEELRTEYEGDKIDLRTAALAMGLNLSDPGPTALGNQELARLLAALDTLEGPAAKEKLDQFFRMERQPWISEMDNMIPVGSAPFTSAQVGQVVQILANFSPSYQNGGNADPNDIDWDKASTQAAAVLSSPQLQVFNAAAQEAHIHRLIKQFYSQHGKAN